MSLLGTALRLRSPMPFRSDFGSVHMWRDSSSIWMVSYAWLACCVVAILTVADVSDALACRDAYHDLHSFSESEDASHGDGSAIRELLQPIAEKMLSLDRSTAKATLSAFNQYFAGFVSRPSQAPANIHDYIPYRLGEFGCEPWLAMLRFSLGLHISECEMEEVQDIVEAAMVSVVLTNDW